MPALAWVALAPFLVSLRRTSGLAPAALHAWWWTIVLGWTVNDWFPRAVSSYYQQPVVVGLAFFLGVCSFTVAPAVMLFAACYRRLASVPPGPGLPLLAAAAWVGSEWIRTELLGEPWALLGYSQASVPVLVQVADLTGVYGTSFAIATVGVALAEYWLAWRAGAVRSLRGALPAALAVAVLVAYGSVRLRDRDPAAHPPVRIAVVQGNLDLGSQWREEFYGRNLDAYLRLTETVLRAERPALVVWPESAVTFFLDTDRARTSAIAEMLASQDVQLLVGGPRAVGLVRPTYYNAAFLLSAAGEVVAWYDKQRLLPFAEYFPLAGLDPVRRRFARVREFSPGMPAAPLPTVAGPAGIVICNEAFFPAPAAERARAGAELLVVLSNDSWLGDPKFSEPAFEMAVVRAVEQRRWLVRASTGGPSAIVDPHGRVLVRTTPGTSATLAGSVIPRQGVTLYGRVGDLFAGLCGAIAALAYTRAVRSRAGDRRPPEGRSVASS